MQDHYNRIQKLEHERDETIQRCNAGIFANWTFSCPERWRVGMKVRFLSDEEWTWNKGQVGIINRVRSENADKQGTHYQVFFTTLLRKDGTPAEGSFRTTPEDVILIEEG